MSNLFKSNFSYRNFGIGLITCSVFGYVFIADDFRHSGEFLGATSILVAGLIFLLIDSKINIFKKFAIQWISFALLIGILVGGVVLDNMPLGIIVCFMIGLILAFAFGNKGN